MVAGPGVGKTQIIDPVTELCRDVKTVHIGPESVTKQGLIDIMAEGQRSIQLPGSTIPTIYHSVLLAAPEFNLLFPSYDQSFLTQCCRFWDGSEQPFEERTRGGKQTLRIDRGIMTILSGIQPSILQTGFPETAWSQGFLTRPIFLYATARPERRSLFSARTVGPSKADLINDLKMIARRTGKVEWSPDAAEAIDQWYLDGCRPVPTHPKLIGYNTRRLENTIKISLLLAIARVHAKIELEDFLSAKDMLLRTEEHYIDMLHEVATTGRPHEDIYHSVYDAVSRYYLTHQKGLPKTTILNIIMGYAPNPYHVDAYFSNMVEAGLLKIAVQSGPESYTPGQYREILT